MIDAPGLLKTLPLVKLRSVFHVGTLDPSLKATTHNSASLEGRGLSVSVHPEAWRSIARLGGDAVWKLARTDKQWLHFVDVRRLTRKQREAVTAWALEQDLVRRIEMIHVSWYDTESECRRSVTFDASDPDEVANAQNEFDVLMEAGVEEEVTMKREPGLASTPTLDARSGYVLPHELAFHMALVCLSEDAVKSGSPITSGLWWDDELDVFGLSAPRGVIHASLVLSLKKTLVQKADHPSTLRPMAGTISIPVFTLAEAS